MHQMSSWSDFDSLNFWESSWIMRYFSPYSVGGGGGNADGSISVASSSGLRPTNNSGATKNYSYSLFVWSKGEPREIVLNEYLSPMGGVTLTQMLYFN